MQVQSEENRYYDKCLEELKELIPKEDKIRILSQLYCELDHTFYGFIDFYKPMSLLIPKNKIVIDFGCYLAAQCYFFKDHAKYIGVDVVGEESKFDEMKLERFRTDNTEHYTIDIERFIKEVYPKLKEDKDDLDFFALCSYVPDFKATELVRKTFKNVCCYYPGGSNVTLRRNEN